MSLAPETKRVVCWLDTRTEQGSALDMPPPIDVRANRPLVVIFENDELAAQGLALVLRDAGYQALVFKSLRDASDARGMDATKVSAIIADYDLDHGFNGVDAAQALRAARSPEPPVLIVTGTQRRDVRSAAQAAGFDFSAKPASAAFLRQWLANKTKTVANQLP